MLKMQSKAISIAASQDQPTLSKEQKAFNTLIRKIEEKRSNLAAWQAAIPLYQSQYVSEFLPLLETTQAMKIELLYCLDSACEQKGLNAAERRMIHALISNLSADLIMERDDEDLKSLYNKHSDSDFDAEEAAVLDSMKAMLENELGLDFDDDLELSTPEDLLAHAQKLMEEQQTQHFAEQEAQAEHQAKRKKTAKQIAKEAQQKAEEQETHLSIRELYRKLASALHPDREPDLQERARKTELMQRINQAYDQKNLLLLLELQMELEHIDQATINNISASRLKHYNKILKEQLSELEHETVQVVEEFKEQFGLSPFEHVAPATILRHLANDIVETQQAIRESKKEILELQDIKKVKIWLKNVKRQSEMDYFDRPF